MAGRAASTSAAVAASSPTWKLLGHAGNGGPSQFRVNLALRHASDLSVYPTRVEYWVRYGASGLAGLPTADESRALAEIEETLLRLVAGRAVLAAVGTARGLRSFLFYAASDGWVEEVGRALQEAVGDRELASRAESDPDWSDYRELVKLSGRNRLGRVIVYLSPLACLAATWAVYGPVWGLGVAAVMATTGPAVLGTRKRAKWCLDHLPLMFGTFSTLMAATLFTFVALIGLSWLPAWGCLLASTAGGVALTASTWRSQVRFWRERTAGSAP